jgi:hypothetical protein
MNERREETEERQANREAAMGGERQSQGLTTADLAGPRRAQPEADREAPRDDSGGMGRGAGVEGAGKLREEPAPLFAGEDAQRFRSRWDSIQTGFVDEPREAVEQADGLVAETIKHLAQTFADERSKLESQWGRGDDISTEDLRVALQRYRSFFDRLLSV